jgi:hypothetical protein
MQVPDFPSDLMPTMQAEDDSVSTFHPGKTINLTNEPDSDEDDSTPNQTNPALVSILRTTRGTESDTMSKTSISDSASRISSLKTELSAMDKAFREELGKLQSQALAQAESQLLHGSMLSEILSTLKQLNLSTEVLISPLNIAEEANPPQTVDAGGSLGVAGHG